MNPTFEKLMAKKKAQGDKMSPMEQKAKGSVLSELMQSMDGMDTDKLQGMKKVTVAAPDKEGLEAGLSKAADLVQKGPLHAMSHDEVGDSGNEPDESDQDASDENHDSDEDPAHEADESPETEADEQSHEEESPEELQAQLEEIHAKLKKHAMRG